MVKLSLPAIEVLASVGGYAGVSFLSQTTAATLLSAAVWLSDTDNWDGSGYELTDVEIDRIKKIVANAESELMQNAIGMIIPSVQNAIPPGTLICDGQTYLRVDYPELYDNIYPSFIIDSTSFFVPDMTARFAGGFAPGIPIGTTGGTLTETLNINQIPSHNHSYSNYQNVPLLEGLGVPYPLAVTAPELPRLTGNRGGSQPHNNVPPYLAVGWLIIAGR